MAKYVPQSGFLSLLMTADGKAIGTKFGIAFKGRWVWKMKDYIDTNFMKLFDRNYLFSDPDTLTNPIENNELFEDEKAEEKVITDKIKARVAELTVEESAKILLAPEDQEDFYEQLFIIGRMGLEEEYQKQVIDQYRALQNL